MSASELFDIAGKKAVVTGGGSGIGTMIATGFVQAGVSVIIASRKEDSLKEVADELAQQGDCSYVVADLSTEEGCRGLGAAVAERWDALGTASRYGGPPHIRRRPKTPKTRNSRSTKKKNPTNGKNGNHP